MSDWSVNVFAARAVALHATNRTEARELLDMLGLLDGPRIAADDRRVYTFSNLVSSGGEGNDPLDRRDHNARPPAGLAHLPPVQEQPKPTRARKATTPKVTTPRKRTRPKKGTRTRRTVAACGTTSGYARHRDRNEKPCQACTEAIRDYQRAYAARRRPADWQPRTAACGTASGYEKHRRLGEPTCRPCKDAQAAKTRERYARNHPGMTPRADRVATCGSTGGYAAHKRRGEPPCRACMDAHNAYLRARYARQKDAS